MHLQWFSWISRGEGSFWKRAAARVCREAGARVTANTRLNDFNLDNINRHDDRRIKVIVFPFWGAQLAVDTALVFPLTSSSRPIRRSGGTRKQQPSSQQYRTSFANLWRLPSSHAGQPSWHMRPTVLMGTAALSASFCRSAATTPRPPAVSSQPAPKKLRVEFGPVLHAHPAFCVQKVEEEKKNNGHPRSSFGKHIGSCSSSVPLFGKEVWQQGVSIPSSESAAATSRRSFLSLPCVLLLCPRKLLYADAWPPLWN